MKTEKVVLPEDMLDFPPDAVAHHRWHRELVPGQLLPRGWRPLFLDEKICRGDMRKRTDETMLSENPYVWDVFTGTIRECFPPRDEIYVTSDSPLHITKRSASSFTLRPAPSLSGIDLSSHQSEQDEKSQKLPAFRQGTKPNRLEMRNVLLQLPNFAWEYTDASIGRAYGISRSTVSRYRAILGHPIGTIHAALGTQQSAPPLPAQDPEPARKEEIRPVVVLPPAPTLEDFMRAESAPLPGAPKPTSLPVRTRKQATKDRIVELANGMALALQNEMWSELAEYLAEYTELLGLLAPDVMLP